MGCAAGRGPGVLVAGLALGLLLAAPALAEDGGAGDGGAGDGEAGVGAVPAELPPPDYRGQQYVDSRGCLFGRAGHGGGTVWVPRVTRAGVAQCGYPPSGQRVPVAGQ